MKLPDITIKRPVQPLASEAMARDQNNQRKAAAGVQAAGQVLNTLDSAIESEAKLNAGRRLNNAQRDYQSEVSRITQEYHTDTDKNLDEFLPEIAAAREKAFSDARNGTSARSSRYVESGLDTLRTNTEPAEAQTLKRLTDSRIKLHLGESVQDGISVISDNPLMAADVIEGVLEGVDSAAIDAAEKPALKSRYSQQLLTTAMTELLRDQEIGEANMLSESEAFKQLPPDAQLAMQKLLTDTTLAATEQATSAVGAAAVRGEMTLDESISTITQIMRGMYNLTDTESNDAVAGAASTVAFNVLDNQINMGQLDDAEAAIQTGKYDAMLGAEGTKKLLGKIKSARDAIARGNVPEANNVERANYLVQLESMEDLVKEARGPLPVNFSEQLEELKTAYFNTWRSVGDVPDTSAEAKVMRIEEAVLDHDLIMGAAGNPYIVASDVLPRPGDDANTARRRQLQYEGVTRRSELFKENLVGFLATTVKYATPGLPDPRGDMNAWLPAFVERVGVVNTAMDQFQTYEISGYLDPVEVVGLNEFLLESMGKNITLKDGSEVNAFTFTLTQLADRLSTQEMYTLFNQLKLDDDAGVIPIAAEIAASGNVAMADAIIMGQGLLDSGDVRLTQSDRDTIENSVSDAVGAAFNGMSVYIDDQNTRQLYNIYKDAITAAYVAAQGNRGADRDQPVDTEILDEIIENITGGTVNIGDEQFIMPTRDTTPAQFADVMSRQDSTTLPKLFDGTGRAIPAEQIDAYWYGAFGVGRFVPTNTGTPGEYYIMDVVGNTGEIDNIFSSPGSLLRNATGGYAVMRFDPNNYVKRQSVRDRRGRAQ